MAVPLHRHTELSKNEGCLSCPFPVLVTNWRALLRSAPRLTEPAQGHRCVSRSRSFAPSVLPTATANLNKCLVQGSSLRLNIETKPGYSCRVLSYSIINDYYLVVLGSFCLLTRGVLISVRLLNVPGFTTDHAIIYIHSALLLFAYPKFGRRHKQRRIGRLASPSQ
jgi:hypothetical protein